MNVKFWGVRGSIPCPGPLTMRYGGNTACIEVRLRDTNRLIIVDAGSGIRELGDTISGSLAGDVPIEIDIFLTHTHWDHIMGFPFFAPIYSKSTKLTVHGPVTYEENTLKEVLSVQWTYRYFPIRHEELASRIDYVDLHEGVYDLGGGLIVKTKYLNHPLLCLGYRFEYGGKAFCTAYDTEPFSNLFITDRENPNYDAAMAAEGEAAALAENQRVEDFISNADLVVFDAQYTRKEYAGGRRGWGHSPMEYAIDLAGRGKVKRLALFHHDVHRTDEQIDALSGKYAVDAAPGVMGVFFAREGEEVVL